MHRSRVAASAALEREPDVAERFWTLVSCPMMEGRCWRWLGPFDRHGEPVFRIPRHSIDAARLAWHFVMGEFPVAGYMHPECGNAHCVRPTHQFWRVSHRARARATSMHEGYVQIFERPTPAMELDALRRGRAPSWVMLERAAS